MKKYLIIFSSILVLALLLSACGTIGKVAGDVVTEYHILIEKYQKAQKMASNFRLCVDTAMGTIYTQATFLQNYQQADVQKAKVWRDALQSAGSKVADLLKNYKDANGNPIPVDQLDLGALANAGALPNGVGSGLTLFVQAFQEAPLAAVSDAPVLAAMNTASEQYNKIDACGTDWNDAVEGYNVERNKIPGDVVGRIAEYLKVKELPASLPFYSGDYKGSVSQPNLPTPSK
jgi:hypothetical protein